MESRKWLLALGVIALLNVTCDTALAQQTKRTFTAADEIGLTLFDSPDGGTAEAEFSPDGNYFVVKGYRGRLDMNVVEDSLYIYRTQDMKTFLSDVQPAAFWVISSSAGKEGAIGGYRWLDDSSGIVLQEPGRDDGTRLVLADLRTKKVEPLTSEGEAVTGFEVRDRRHYVYTTTGQRPKSQDQRNQMRGTAAVVETGRTINDILFPRVDGNGIGPVRLWAVVNGKRFEVKSGGAPLKHFDGFALSPDGNSILSKMPVADVPQSWETLYPRPPYSISQNRIHAGHYEGASSRVHHYVKVDLETGAIRPLLNAPLADDAGWLAVGGPSWSADGKQVLLPNTFVASKDGKPSRPCVAQLDLVADTSSCVEVLKGKKDKDMVEEGYHFVWGARFVGGNPQKVQIAFIGHEDQSFGTTDYQRAGDGWKSVRDLKGVFPAEESEFMATEKETINDPPVWVATDGKITRTIFDPNPKLKNVALSVAEVYDWKDREGREWKGGLYKPVDYQSGHRYPLVIQTHGFPEDEFRPSGVFPTAMAARALAARGILVLQMAKRVPGANYRDCADVTADEGPCGAAMLEGAARKLVQEGLADPNRIGAVGFSRTCYQVMQTLAFGSAHLRAASVTDGFMFDSLQYLLFNDRVSGEADRVIGSPPFGEGFKLWQERSPGSHLDKISTALMVVAEGPADVLFMWQPYAALHYLKKPVDLIMLNTDEHVLSNPAVRLASQQGSVDWFCFWLQGYEDPDPSKADQYKRWRGLKKMQEENDAKASTDRDLGRRP